MGGLTAVPTRRAGAARSAHPSRRAMACTGDAPQGARSAPRAPFRGTRLPWGGLSERRARAGASPSPCSRTPPRRRASVRSRPLRPRPAASRSSQRLRLHGRGEWGTRYPGVGGRGQGVGGARWAGPGRREDRRRAPRRGEMPGTRGRSHRCADGGRPAPGAHTGARRWPVRTRAEDHREDPRPGIGWAPGWRARRREAR